MEHLERWVGIGFPGRHLCQHRNSSCPGGESAEEMQARVDRVISMVRGIFRLISWSSEIEQVRDYHRNWFEEGRGNRDALIVAHGHFNRCLIARWNDFTLETGTFSFMHHPVINLKSRKSL